MEYNHATFAVGYIQEDLMATEEEIDTQVKHGTKTTRTKRKTGEISKSLSLGRFPIRIHQEVKSYSSRRRTVESIYSEAISKLRADHDAGMKFLVHGPGSSGRKTYIWLEEKSREDLRYLCFELKCFNRQIVYTAILHWLDDQRKRREAAKEFDQIFP
jgi:hypothetical protein